MNKTSRKTLLAAVLAILMVAGAVAVLLPSDVDAANPTFDYGEDGKNVNNTGVDIATSSDGLSYVIANGVPIIINDDDMDGNADFYAVVNGEEVELPTDDSKTYNVVGGSINKDVVSSSITMNGGTVQDIFGGGFYDATVTNATIRITGGTASYVAGGGWAGAPYNNESGSSSAESIKGYNCTTSVSIEVTGGTMDSLIGGGRFSLAYVGETTMNVTGGKVGELIAGGINGITDKSTVTIDGVVIDAALAWNGGYTYDGVKHGVITAANRGEVGEVEITINSLGEGSKAIVTVGALSDATYSDGGTNAVVRDVTVNVPDEIDAVFLMGSTVNNKNNPWYGEDVTTTSPTMDAVIYFNAPNQTLIAQDCNVVANQVNSTVYHLNGGLTLVEGATLSIPNGMTVNGKISVAGVNSASVDVENLTAGTGGITLTAGSITISGAISAAQNVMITAEGKVSIDGTIVEESTGSLTIETTGEGDDVTIGNLTIPASATLIIAQGATVDVTGTVTGDMYVAGTVTTSGSGSLLGATVTVDANTGVVPDDIAESVVTNYNLLGNIDKGVVSGKGWEYDTETDTLKLNGFNGDGYFYYADLDKVEITNKNVIEPSIDAIKSFDVNADDFGAIRNDGTSPLTITGEGSLEISISGEITDDSLTLVSGIYAQDVTIKADITINNTLTIDCTNTGVDASGVLTIDGATVVANVECSTIILNDATVNGTITMSGDTATVSGNVTVGTIGAAGKTTDVNAGNLVADTIVGKLDVDAQSTVMVGTLTLDADAGSTSYTNLGYVVIETAISYENSKTLTLIQGIESNPVTKSTFYLGDSANVTVDFFVLPEAKNPVDPENVVNILTGDVAAGETVVVIAIQAEFNDNVIAGNVTVAGTATGSVVMNGGTLTVGTANGLTIGNAAFTEIENLVISGTGDDIAVSSNIAKGELSFIDPAGEDGTVITFEPGVKITEMDLSNDDNTVTLSGITAGTNGMTVSYGSIDLGGDIVVDGEAVMDGGKLTLNNANVTGTGTISVDELTIEGTVTIGEGIVIELAPGAESGTPAAAKLIISKNAVLTGDGIVMIADKTVAETVYGTIVNNDGTIDVEVQVPATGIVVNNSAEFIAALPYYNNIKVSEDFAEDFVKIDSDVNVAGTPTAFTTIDLNNEKLVIENGASVTLTNVTIKNAAAGIEVKGSLDINSSYVYSNVTIGTTDVDGKEVKGTVTVTTPLETHLRGDAGFPAVDIGYGNILYVEANMTIQGQSAFTVYGSLVVAEGSTLIAAGQPVDTTTGEPITAIIVEKSGTIEVAGTMAAQCSMEVKGTIEVAGTLTVDGAVAVTGEIAVTGDMTVNAKGTVTGSGSVSVAAGAELAMNGTSATNIVDKGTVTVNGTVNGTVVTIYSGATLNIEKAAGEMTVKDTGTVEDYKAPEGTTVTVDPVQDGNQIVLTDSAGYVITVDIVDKETADGTNKIQYQAAVMDVAGAAVEGTVVATPAVGLTVSDSLDIAKGSFKIDGTVPVEITGTVTVGNGATISTTANLTVSGSVAVTSETEANAKIVGENLVSATYYDITVAAAGETPASYTRTYTTFDKAVAVIGDADDDTVYVNNGQSAETTIENVAGTVVINDGAVLTIDADVTLGFAATGGIRNLDTVAVTADGGKNIVVDGTLYFADYAKYIEGAGTQAQPVSTPKISADVAIIDGAARTYTSLANAIKMAGTETTTITLNQDVTIKDDLTIPANITVASDMYGITVGETTSKKDVTLTIYGSIQLVNPANDAINENTISLVQGTQIPGTEDDVDYYYGALVLMGSGYIYLEESGTIASDETDVNVAGAYYQRLVDADGDATTSAKTVEVISTIEHAADDSENVKTDVDNAGLITIRGAAPAGDVEFVVPKAASEDVTTTLSIVLDAGASMTVSSMTIVPGVTVNGIAGTITGSITSDVGTVDLDKVTGITIVSVAANEENETVEMLTINGTDVKGDVTVSAGTVTVPTSGLTVNGSADKTSSLTVSAGATVDAAGNVATNENAAVNVDGTMNIADTEDNNIMGAFDVTGTVNVTGALNVTGKTVVGGNGTVNVTGTEEADAALTIGEAEIAGTVEANAYSTVTFSGAVTITGTVTAAGTLTINENVTVGELPTDEEGYYALGTAVTGTLTATAPEGEDDQVDLVADKYVKAYYGAAVTGLGDDVKSTAYHINGKVYMTVYASSGVTIIEVALAENFMVTQDGLALDTGLKYQDDIGYDTSDSKTRNTGLYNAANWFTTSNMRPNTLLTGTEAVGSNANVYAAAETVPVNVTITVTDGLTLYIDGIPYASGVYQMSVGTHTVFVNATAGFKADNATISLAGQTVVTGTATGTITISADMANATIVATGAEQSGTQIIVPENPDQEPPVVNVNTGNGEMSLTDYLLIILVVLIVIMAIIVALRLMRS